MRRLLEAVAEKAFVPQVLVGTGVCLVVIGGVLFFGRTLGLPAVSADAGTPPTPAALSAVATGREPAPLSDAERSQAIKFALHGIALNGLAEGRAPEVVRVEDWYRGSGAKLGAAVTVALDEPLTGIFSFIDMTYAGDDSDLSQRPYTRWEIQSEVSGVAQLRVMVDLGEGIVVQLVPDDDSQIIRYAVDEPRQLD